MKNRKKVQEKVEGKKIHNERRFRSRQKSDNKDKNQKNRSSEAAKKEKIKTMKEKRMVWYNCYEILKDVQKENKEEEISEGTNLNNDW